ncbi:hypothetical protein [Pyrobaculum sp.]|uniref:hypothetical protein n=1 Tax=Pyrobaculum sp. TaxID=2004705 RepID=UPI003D1022E3
MTPKPRPENDMSKKTLSQTTLLIGVLVTVITIALATSAYQKHVGLLVIGKPEPDTLIAWAYFWWDPKTISAGSTTYLNGGITVMTLFGYASYSVDIRVYDNSPDLNGPPQIISSSLTGCSANYQFYYDTNLKAWRFYSGMCNYQGRPGTFNFGITASWSPKVTGTYTGESYACIHEPPAGGCESARDLLTVN